MTCFVSLRSLSNRASGAGSLVAERGSVATETKHAPAPGCQKGSN